MSQEEKKNSLSRRRFLVSGAAVATGIIATGVTGCGTTTTTATDTKPAPATGEAPQLPLPYKPLDVEKIRKEGYENYFKGGCMYTTAHTLITNLQEVVGGPWKQINTDMFRFGAGGALNWGTLCGALNGCLSVLNLATDQYAELGNELMGWYTTFSFPSKKHEDYCHFKDQVQTVANSPLCHASVSKWAVEAGARIGEKEKKDRCAKLSGDTAARCAELLNELHANGKIAATYAVGDDFSHCMSCHQSKDSLLDNEQGKMNCIECHDDHTKNGAVSVLDKKEAAKK